jgi:exopolyphosphatase/guanosine-5'-triphosphate,3'-diphosphate pyrophosphatase
MRVAVVDVGTNSTRLFIADVHDDGRAEGLFRESQVTRLGENVDATGTLSEAAIERTAAMLGHYRQVIDEHHCEANLAVMTSAARDAANGPDFMERVRREFGLDARTLSGDEEAQLTFLGAMSGHSPARAPAGGAEPDASGAAAPSTVVVDIGGGSTEFILGSGGHARFHTSLQAGVVRMSERHIHSDPPVPAELQTLASDTRAIFQEGLPANERGAANDGIAVAGTATSAAAIAQELDPYDPARVHGYRLALGTVELLLARLADMTEAQRRRVVGLHPDRAPTIVAGMILLIEAMRAFGLDQVEVSEQDLLLGGALKLAGVA